MNLPVDVRGIASTNKMASGNHHLAKCGARKSRSSCSVAAAPDFSTTAATGRSSHFGCSAATTAASATAGCAMS